MTFVTGPVRVSVPATSANLGPGFDSLGLALELRDELEATVTGSGLGIDVAGEGAGDVARDETHLVVQAMRAAFDVLGEHPSGLLLSCRNRIPHSRGLGSSAAAIVGGIFLARDLVAEGGGAMTVDAAFGLAAELEGHPDNVAPAVYGGLTVAGRSGEAFFATRTTVAPTVRAVAFVPPTGLSTELARGLLPEVVSHRHAAANAGRAALLVAALAGQPDLLLTATEDLLHQPYRRPAMPGSLDLVDRLRADGHAAVISGAGPSVLVLCADGADLASYTPNGWTHLPLGVATAGVRTG
ncbi:MAG TPA: homoserine kinase [Nocardioides sp.]|nr:homoserine kinase [Nocardioides sp.]